MSDSSGKRKTSIINLSLFANLSETFSNSSSSSDRHASSSKSAAASSAAAPPKSNKTPRKFGDGGVVGLGIVAAMNKNDENNKTHDADFAATNKISKSQPIPIVSVKPFAKVREPTLEIDEMELSESYTCVISRVGNNNNNSVKKREYFGGDEQAGDTANGDLQQQQQGLVFFTSPPKYSEPDSVFQASDDFLSTCCLCKKKLYGLDIFMYKGYKAFCSEDCRSKQIRIDDRKRKRQSDSVKKPFDYSVSPCSAPRFFTASVAAA